jgi:hypothetical protein
MDIIVGISKKKSGNINKTFHISHKNNSGVIQN